VLRVRKVIATVIGLVVIARSQYLMLSNTVAHSTVMSDIYGDRMTEVGPNMLPQYSI